MNAKVKDVKELFRILASVDEDNFAIVENECVRIYSKEDFLPTPMPYGSCVIEIPNESSLHDGM